MTVYPSIASSNCLEYGKELKRLAGWDYLHIDIEDGNFTPNITFGLKTTRAICAASSASNIQVHLMTNKPESYVDELHCMGVSEVYAHVEALDNPLKFISHCHGLGIKAGLSLKADTPFEAVTAYLDAADGLLFLTSHVVSPWCEDFCLQAYERLFEIRDSIPEGLQLAADGALNEERINRLAGINFSAVVTGRLVFSSNCYLGTLERLSKLTGGNL